MRKGIGKVTFEEHKIRGKKEDIIAVIASLLGAYEIAIGNYLDFDAIPADVIDKHIEISEKIFDIIVQPKSSVTKCPDCGHWIRKAWLRRNLKDRVVCTKLGGHILLPKGWMVKKE